MNEKMELDTLTERRLARRVLWKLDLDSILEEQGIDADWLKENEPTRPEAKKLIKELAYLLMYIVKDERGLPASKLDAFRVIDENFGWLVEIAGYKKYASQVVARQAKRRFNEIWEESFDGRRKLASQRFRDRISEIDIIMPAVVSAIKNGDLDRVQEYVALAKLDAANVGYQAAQRYEFGLSDGKDALTEADKLAAQRAVAEVRDYEKKLLASKQDDIIDGELVDGDN